MCFWGNSSRHMPCDCDGGLHRGTSSKPWPFVHYRHGLVNELHAALRLRGIPPSQYKGHSFRIGAATTAARCGLEDSLIQMLGRWKSSAYRTYIRIPQQELAATSAALLRNNYSPTQKILTNVYSRSVDPRKLRVGVKYYVVHSCIHKNHILRLQVCTHTVRANCAQKCTRLFLLCSCLLCIFFHGGQAKPIQTS